jgi:hypothetical protein
MAHGGEEVQNTKIGQKSVLCLNGPLSQSLHISDLLPNYFLKMAKIGKHTVVLSTADRDPVYLYYQNISKSRTVDFNLYCILVCRFSSTRAVVLNLFLHSGPLSLLDKI